MRVRARRRAALAGLVLVAGAMMAAPAAAQSPSAGSGTGADSGMGAVPGRVIEGPAPPPREAVTRYRSLQPHETALLRTLDKITARVARREVAVGSFVRFGSLRVAVLACRKAPPEEEPESAAFLVIDELSPGTRAERVFSGWMFASSPALSALAHPVYDVWVLDCKNSKASASSSPQ